MQSIAKRMLRDILSQATSLARDVDQVNRGPVSKKSINGKSKKDFISLKVNQIIDKHQKLSQFLGVKDE